MISRRKLLTGSAAAAAYATLPSHRAMAANGTIPGAIRWDAWYGSGAGSEGSVNTQVGQTLAPAALQYRAPWFAVPASASVVSINGNQQATMDAEIAYAAGAGLKYWAYCWYGEQTPPSPMQNAWTLHQSSSVKNSMNWCMILQLSRVSSSAGSFTNQSTYLSYFQQANYQTVLSGRPLVYLLMDGGSATGLAASITSLRAACSSAGVGSPYIVVMFGSVATAAGYVTTYGADAISNYTAGSNTTTVTPWATFEATVEAYWTAQVGTTAAVIPICMVGLDSRPRKLHPPAFLGSGKPNFNMSNYVVAPTGSQLTSHLQAAVSFVVANPTPCASKAILIYSWDECDEFGAIIPSYNSSNPASPITTALNAVGAVVW